MYLACASDTGTAHLYHVAHPTQNPRSALEKIKSYLPSYFSSQWSFTQFTFRGKVTLGFGTKNVIWMINNDLEIFKGIFFPDQSSEAFMQYDQLILPESVSVKDAIKKE